MLPPTARVAFVDKSQRSRSVTPTLEHCFDTLAYTRTCPHGSFSVLHLHGVLFQITVVGALLCFDQTVVSMAGGWGASDAPRAPPLPVVGRIVRLISNEVTIDAR